MYPMALACRGRITSSTTTQTAIAPATVQAHGQGWASRVVAAYAPTAITTSRISRSSTSAITYLGEIWCQDPSSASAPRPVGVRSAG